MMKHNFKIGDRVKWKDSALNIWTYRRRNYVDIGTIYRIDKTRIAVLPDSWAKEGHKQGLLRSPNELTLIS